MSGHPRLGHRIARRMGGFSLIEMMVAVGIGLVVTLAVTTLLVRSESSKRTISALSDTSQTGAYVAYTLDRAIRSGGTGFADGRNRILGCELGVSRAGATIVPPPAGALPAPFAALNGRSVRLAPVVIHKGASAGGSDVIAIMSGASGRGEARMRVLATDIDRLMLPNTLTLRANDLLLLHNGTRCMVQQVAAGFSNAVSLDVPVTLAGTYAANAAGASALGDFGDGGAGAYLMGNLNDSRPQFQLIGVGADRALFSYDLLRLGPDDAPMPVADSVVALRALYGVDTNGDGRQDVWVDPIDGTDFGADMLLDGSAASNARLQQIVSLRVGLVLRTSLLEREARPLDTVTLFGDLPAAQQQSLEIAGDDQRYHYRTVESTVPLRNAMP